MKFTHFCHFYETKQDLLDTLVPYFKAGLESKEFCVWVVSNSELITVEEAKGALAQAVPDLDRHLADENIEILNGLDWYLEENVFNLERVTRAWEAKLKRALALGYDGMRVSGDTFWLAEKDWKDFCAYEKQLNDSITDQPMTVLCTYPLARSGAGEVLDVVQAHQFAIARRQGEWEVIETPELIQAKAEIKKLNEALEQRVVERTNELRVANEALISEIDQRRRVEEELRARAADLTEAQRVAKIGNWILNLRTNKVTWSEQLYRIFEIEERDFDGRYESFVSRIHPDDQPRVLRTNTQARIEGSPFDIEYRIITPNDQVRIIREVGYATQDEAGQVIRLFGTAQDITERRQAEEALRKSEERFRQLAENIREVFWMSTPEFDAMLYISPAYESVWGRTCKSLYQDPRAFIAAIHPEDRARVVEVIERDRERGFEVEYRVVRPDGSIRWIRDRGFPIKDESGNFYRIAGLAEDITQRRSAEDELEKEKEILEKIFDNIPVMIGFVGDDGRVKLVNPEWERTIGWTLKELEEQNVDIFAEAYPDLSYRQQVLDFVAAPTGEWTDLKIRVRDGRMIDAACAVVHLSDGTRVAIAQDITERKRAEDALRRSEDRIRLIIDTIPTMAWSVRPDGVVDFLNQRWLDYTGLSLEQYVEEPTGPIHPEDVSRVIEKWLSEMAVGEPYEAEMRLRRADGEYRWFLVRTVPLRDEQGNLVKWYGVSTDIEDLKRAEEALKESQRRLEEAQRIAHVGHWDRDLETRRIAWSDEIYRILGLPLERDSPRTEWLDVVHPEDRPRLSVAIEEMLRGIRRLDMEFRIVRPNREVRFLHSQGDVIRDERGRPVRMFGTAQDVTERKLAEEQLKATTEQLRALSARLQSAREEEGTRIAREIHDELGSMLTTLKWDLEDIQKTLSTPVDQSQLAAVREKLSALMNLDDMAINALRRIASELRPSLLDDLGLGAAIEWQAQQFQTRTGIICHCESALENIGLNEEQSTAVFRIFQEALTNVLRHAQATRVDIAIKKRAGYFVLVVGDNGKGITQKEKSEQQSLGILGMRERAHLIGAEIDIKGLEGKGTVVTVRVPISGQDRVLKMTR